MLCDKRYYVWANESCDNVTEDLGEAIKWAKEFVEDGAEYVYIADENNDIVERFDKRPC